MNLEATVKGVSEKIAGPARAAESPMPAELVKPAQRWVGALRVTGEAFQSDEPVWGLTETGEARYPWRFLTEPIVALDPPRGIPVADTVSQLGFLSRLKKWGVYLQRSLNRVPDDDGDKLLALLQQPRQPIPSPHDHAHDLVERGRPGVRRAGEDISSRA